MVSWGRGQGAAVHPSAEGTAPPPGEELVTPNASTAAVEKRALKEGMREGGQHLHAQMRKGQERAPLSRPW